MKTLTAREARADLYRLIDETATAHKPVVISGKRHNAVLVSADDWAAIQETIYLLSIPGMRESIREGMVAPLSEFDNPTAYSRKTEVAAGVARMQQFLEICVPILGVDTKSFIEDGRD